MAGTAIPFLCGEGGVMRWGIIGFLVLTVALASCGLIRPSEELRYRLTVEVETPQGLKTGSSVIEVRGVKNPDWVTPEGRGTRGSLRGEAVAVDLPGGKTLFALLKGEEGGGSDGLNYPYLAFKSRLNGAHEFLDTLRRMRDLRGEVAVLPATQTISDYQNGKRIQLTVACNPLFVVFVDIADPRTVMRVDPAALDKSFGPGVKLRRITVQITDDKVTTGIIQKLSWLDHLDRYRTDPKNVFTSTLPSEIGALRHRDYE
jgi:hypothetical protein